MKTEVIAIASGKGGTGKTVLAACLGYSLNRADHRVLMVDTDTATDGLSLFLLGPEGSKRVESLPVESTFTGILDRLQDVRSEREPSDFKPLVIDRQHDHGVIYKAFLSGRGLYGDPQESSVPRLDRNSFRSAVRSLLNGLRQQGEYDYILLDTRGGFSFESLEICALADSFIVVTESDYTSFYQDRNLILRINAAGQEVNARPVLRSIIVNKATETREESFRWQLEREFPIAFSDTHPVPLDLDVIVSYKTHRMPLVDVPGSEFSFALLTAFAQIFRIVTASWSQEQTEKWNELVDSVTHAVAEKNKTSKREETAARWTQGVVYTCLIVGAGICGSVLPKAVTSSLSALDWGILVTGLGLCGLCLWPGFREVVRSVFARPHSA